MNTRIYFLWFLFLVAFAVILARLVFLQWFKQTFLLTYARKQHNVVVSLPARRGIITDRNGHILAFDVSSFSLYASARNLSEEERQKLVNILSPLLSMEKKVLYKKLSSNRAFVWLKRKLPFNLYRKISSLKLKNIGWIREYGRMYPDGYIAGQLIGFVDVDRKGLSGIELQYDSSLKGEPGKMYLVRDGRRITIPLYEDGYIPPKDGLNLQLTIDEVIQCIAERALDVMQEKFKVESCWATVMDPYTGEILAMASRPKFNPNYPSKFSFDAMRIKSITDVFEPGSVFKLVLATAAIEERIVSLDEKIFCENGKYKVATHVLHDYHPYGWLTFAQVIEKSSNIGVVKVAQKLGAKRYFRYVNKFLFGRKTGIDLPGEVSGIIRSPEKWSSVDISNIPIGQGIGVTSIQLARMVSAIANGGFLVRPYVAEAILDRKGLVLRQLSQSEKYNRKKIISMDTVRKLHEIMQSVVDAGTGRRARICGISVAGKTGTAQRVIDGKYSNVYFMSSFIGFAPVESPQLVVVVTAETKKPYHFGGVVCAPIFAKIVKETLSYMGILVDQEECKNAKRL